MARLTILPNSVAVASHIKTLDIMSADRLADINLGLVLVNLIDTAPVEALPFLAIQFNLSGYKGWKFADTEQKQRDLLKRAIELNRYKGTPYGLRQALIMAGVIGDIEIRERLVLRHNGEFYHNGIGFYGNHWAYFRVLIDVANLGGISLEDLQGVIKEYKGARNWLLDVTYKQAHRDQIEISDDILINITVPHSDRVHVTDSMNTTQIP
jgi:phage tail P2-like protein